MIPSPARHRPVLPARTTRAVGLTALLALALGFAAPQAEAQDAADSLPGVTSGQRPGPDVLYADEPAAPQLANHDPRFSAPTLRVSGAEAYVAGEYLYTDHLYDDFGADTDGGASSAPVVGDGHEGNLSYPTDRDRYADNAADLVEFRIVPGQDAVTYRITLGALPEPDATIVAIALDTDRDEDTGTSQLPGDPGAPFPGTDEVITVWGTGAEHVAFDADGDEIASNSVDVEADLAAGQLTVTVPRDVSDPRGTVRTTVATGLYDRDGGGWLLPGDAPDSETPGGASPLLPDPPGIFNLAFRFDEEILTDGVPPDVEQARALADREPTRFAHDIDFAKLDAGDTDRSGVPTTGTMVRLFPSRLDLGPGQDRDSFPAFLGQLQPYSVYVPEDYDPADPPGLTLNMHSLGQHHFQYNGSEGVRQLGEERYHVVATPLARGTDGWYQHEAEYDVFEMWNDLARQLRLDPDRVTMTGYSMGGYATYRLGGRYPDLVGTAMTVVGPPGDGIWLPPAPPTGGAETLSNHWLENTRNVPYLNIATAEDELVPIIGPTVHNVGTGALADGLLTDVLGEGIGVGQPDEAVGFTSFEELGHRYRYRVYPLGEHFTIALLDYDLPGSAAFLGDGAVDRDPPHVTFASVPAADDADLGLVADGAYWVSDITLADRDAGDVPKGVVDAFSHGHGQQRPETVRHTDAGVGPAALAWTEVGLDWAEPVETEPANLLEVELTNTAAATIDLARAALDPERELTIEVVAGDDGELTLDGAFPAGTQVTRDGEQLSDVTADADGVRLPVTAGESVFVLGPVEQTAAPGRPDDGPGHRPDQPPADTRTAATPATGGGTGLLGVALLGAAVLFRRRA